MIITDADRERFWLKVSKSGGCWTWKAGQFETGYGKFWINGRSHYAHRVAASMKGAEITTEMFVCHRCDNPPCVNPDHLFIGTPAENTRDMINKGRKFLPFGMENPSARNAFHEVQAARLLVANGMCQREVARKFSVSFTTMCKWVNNKTRKHA